MGTLPITIVSGLPRSGTSMMMQALSAGGMPVLTDNRRVADEDNPRGYFELEAVKRIRQETTWLAQAPGKAVKVVSALLPYLPRTYAYKIIFMQRALDAVLASQQATLRRHGVEATSGDAAWAGLLERHLTRVTSWLRQQPNTEVVYVHYAEVVADPATHLARVGQFLGRELDLGAMRSVVDPRLHRQRQGVSHRGVITPLLLTL